MHVGVWLLSVFNATSNATYCKPYPFPARKSYTKPHNLSSYSSTGCEANGASNPTTNEDSNDTANCSTIRKTNQYAHTFSNKAANCSSIQRTNHFAHT